MSLHDQELLYAEVAQLRKLVDTYGKGIARLAGERDRLEQQINLNASPSYVDRRAHLAERLGSDSWANRAREVRRRRLDAVMKLSIELARLREMPAFSTRLAEMALESVIGGDWKMVDEWAEHFAFADEGEDLRQKYVPLFSIFRELLLQALRAEKEVPA